MASRKGTSEKTLQELIDDFSGKPVKPKDLKTKRGDKTPTSVETAGRAILADRHKAPVFRRFAGK